MISASFDYARAASVDEAIALLCEDDQAMLLAGGHSLIPRLRRRNARPSRLVDIGRIDTLRYVREDEGEVAIGALARHSDLVRSRFLAHACPPLVAAAASIGDPQVRNRGTIGGSLSQADPAADIPPVLAAAGATLVAQGPSGTRQIPIADFFSAEHATTLGGREVLTEIRFPPRAAGTYLRHTRRAHEWPTVGVAAIRADDGPRVALAGMGPTVLRAKGVEEALADGASAAEAAARATEHTQPSNDVFASSEYRAHLAVVLVRRALEQLPQ